MKNPGFEDAPPNQDTSPIWITVGDGPQAVRITDKEAHGGRQSLALPAQSAVGQKIKNLRAGAYMARCWVKSEAEQRVTFLLEDTDRPWSAYNYAEIKVPKGRWEQIEVYCALNQDGSLTLTLGGMSAEFRAYHGTEQAMKAPILADDFELIRCQPRTPLQLVVWDVDKNPGGELDWVAKGQWPAAQDQAHAFLGTPVFQSRQLAGVVRKDDGALVIYAAQGQALKKRGVVMPSPSFKASHCALVKADDRTGIRVAEDDGAHSYTAWLTGAGVIKIEPGNVSQFAVQECRLRHGILPSFVGADVCYDPGRMPGITQVSVPSTQWFAGLVEGNDCMLVAVWDDDSQAVSLGLAGEGGSRMIDSLSIGTAKAGFSLSFVEHRDLWHREVLKEDWLGEYTPIGWERPFPARWMAHFFLTPGGERSFDDPNNYYSFPIAAAKTRMWGVWFEDWNHYPFYFDGVHTMAHFEKTFVPNGDALIYFLEPAAADLYSPCEIVEQALGPEKAAALFDWDANQVGKLEYSTPDDFMYDRPVCATTTHLTEIRQKDKATVGVNLATHLYEFIRGIRGRLDQYGAFFAQMKEYLEHEKTAHPEARSYLGELEALVVEAQSKPGRIYATPLSTVQAKTESIKKLLRAGQGDGLEFARFDVRGIAGEQDDLCRHYNRLVMSLMQTAALKCGDSPEKAVMAKNIWDQSRKVLRRPSRWESRRTLYFFEP